MIAAEDKKWDYALGMGRLSGAEPSLEFLEMVEKEKRGEMTTQEMREALYKKYNIRK